MPLVLDMPLAHLGAGEHLLLAVLQQFLGVVPVRSAWARTMRRASTSVGASTTTLRSGASGGASPRRTSMRQRVVMELLRG
jgi:hypothetical protein